MFITLKIQKNNEVSMKSVSTLAVKLHNIN